jgi:uncharacterized protein YhbP (UPF0306 family)
MNMAGNSRVSAAIHGDYRHWKSIRGIQLEGRVELLRSSKLQSRFWSVYTSKFPFVTALFDAAAPSANVRRKLAGIRRYRLRPERVWYIDNHLGFGHRQLLDLAPISPFEFQ